MIIFFLKIFNTNKYLEILSTMQSTGDPKKFPRDKSGSIWIDGIEYPCSKDEQNKWEQGIINDYLEKNWWEGNPDYEDEDEEEFFGGSDSGDEEEGFGSSDSGDEEDDYEEDCFGRSDSGDEEESVEEFDDYWVITCTEEDTYWSLYYDIEGATQEEVDHFNKAVTAVTIIQKIVRGYLARRRR